MIFWKIQILYASRCVDVCDQGVLLKNYCEEIDKNRKWVNLCGKDKFDNVFFKSLFDWFIIRPISRRGLC